MSETYPSGCAGGAIRAESGHVAALRAVDWLYLAAAPTFAIMALLGRSRRRPAGYLVLGGGTYVAAERNDPDVLADERLPFAALAEADL
jgi:hypothetical protein